MDMFGTNKMRLSCFPHSSLPICPLFVHRHCAEPERQLSVSPYKKVGHTHTHCHMAGQVGYHPLVIIELTSWLVIVIVSPWAIQSPRVTRWGDWGCWEDCPYRNFVHGMRLKTEPAQTGTTDDTALNGVQLFCSPIGSNSRITKIISSSQGRWGSWGRLVKCPGITKAIGFQLRSEPDQGTRSDDTGANNFRLICDGDVVLEGDGTSWGNWTMERRCPRFEYLCGVRTQVEDYQGSSVEDDDTALNNIDMDCCSPFAQLTGF